MLSKPHITRFAAFAALTLSLAVAGGCRILEPDPASLHHLDHAHYPTVPKELAKSVLPPYIIEAPDILVIEATHVLPRPPYRLRTLDVVSIEARGVLDEAPIAGNFRVEPGGVVNLGYPYGQVRVVGLTPQQAADEIRAYLAERFNEPSVSVSLLEMAAMQQILGEHLVAMDGTVTLGVYGKVLVAGLSIEEARCVIERHLAQFLENPEVSVDVFAYNSKKYYVIAEGAGLGDVVQPFPITGNETVLDAIANVNGLQAISSKRIWIARPSPEDATVTILPVDWVAITAYGVAETNYQLLPGDRVFIEEDRLVAWDNQLAKAFAPVERIFGFSILGVNTMRQFSGRVLQNNGNNNNFGGGGF
jgi:polysaccharide export outer membrane protein